MPHIPQISRVQALIYDLPVSRVMTRDVIALTPLTLMRELKELLRVRRISGTPVVEGGRLVGVISVEDLVKALERGEIDLPVCERMTRRVITIQPQESVIEAVKKFAQCKVGRLPVVDDQGRLVGILTGGDITRGLLEAIGLSDQDEERSRFQSRPALEDLASDETLVRLKYRVQGGDFKGGGRASSRLKTALLRLGVDAQTVRRAAIAAYEGEMNLIIHTGGGGELSAEITPGRIRLLAEDAGPGIADVERAMQPGFSTAPNWIRELGFGAGMGLCNIRRCADRMELCSTPGAGTRLEAIFLSPEAPAPAAAGEAAQKGGTA